MVIARRTLVAAVVAATALVVLVSSMAWLTLLRDTMHIGCEYTSEGEGAGQWACADGIGYLIPGAVVLVLEAAAGIAGIALLATLDPGRWRALAALGVAPIAIIGIVRAMEPTASGLPSSLVLPIALLGASAVASVVAACLGPGVTSRVVLLGSIPLDLAAVVLGVDLLPAGALAAGLAVVAALTAVDPATSRPAESREPG